MYSKLGVVYKLHAGWFINRTPGEFINCGLFIEFKGLLCGNATERGASLKLNLWPPGSLVAHDCGHPLSRYTCRATRVAADFLDFIAFYRCSIGVALHPLKILVSHLPPLCREVSHRNLGLKIGRTPKGAYSPRGRGSRHLLETPFSEPLLRTLLRTLFYCKTHSRPPSQNPL